MHLNTLIKNFSNTHICKTWRDKFRYVSWLYSDKYLVKKYLPRQEVEAIAFQYPPPLGEIELLVRNNRGADFFIFSEVFEHRYYDLPLLSEPHSILDLGANIGLTAIFLAKQYPKARMACVEPMPNNVELLKKNLRLNDVNADIFSSAISTEDGSIKMIIDCNDYGHKVSDIEYGKQIDGETVKVQALAVTTLMQNLGWERINLLKVDIEGYEAVLLKENCEWLTLVDAICIECHEGYGEQDLHHLAQQWGFGKPQLLPGNWLLIRESGVAV